MKTQQASSDRPRPARRSGKFGFIRMGLLLLVVAIGIYAVVAYAAKKDDAGAESAEGKPAAPAYDAATAKFTPVQRGPLTISLLVPGTIQTRNTTSIINMLEEDARILWVIPEGTRVKKGDKIVELESSGLDDEVYEQRREVLVGEADLNTAMQELKLQEQENRSALMTAENELEVAKLELKKYVEGTALTDKLTKQSDITLADLELQRAEEKLGWTKKLVDKGYVSSGELQSDELEVTKNKIELEKNKNALNVFEAYEKKAEQLKVENAVREAEAELERIALDNTFKLKSKQIAVQSAEAELDEEKNRMRELEAQLANTILNAPEDGMVVYANNRDRWNAVTIEIGAELRNRQKIIDLPDFSSWRVEARVHESVIQQVNPGQRARVAVDAFGGMVLPATVDRVAVMPDSGGRWMAPDVKEYIVNLNIEAENLPPLKPGMTSKNEIILNDLTDVLYVPLNAVSSTGDETYVMVQTPTGVERRVVKLGQSNDSYVVVNSGLKEGEAVLLMAQGAGISGIMDRPGGDRKGRKGREGGAEGGAAPGGNAPAGEAPDGKREEAPASMSKGAGDGAVAAVGAGDGGGERPRRNRDESVSSSAGGREASPAAEGSGEGRRGRRERDAGEVSNQSERTTRGGDSERSADSGGERKRRSAD